MNIYASACFTKLPVDFDNTDRGSLENITRHRIDFK